MNWFGGRFALAIALASTSAIWLPFNAAWSAGYFKDWYVINMVTYQCEDLARTKYPFRSPADYIAWERGQGALTNVTIMPNIPIGTWAEVHVVPPFGPEWSVEFFQPRGTCEMIRDYETQQGVLPDPNRLK